MVALTLQTSQRKLIIMLKALKTGMGEFQYRFPSTSLPKLLCVRRYVSLMCIRLISSLVCFCQFDRHGPCLPAKGCGFPSNRKHVKLLWTPAFSALPLFSSALGKFRGGVFFKGMFREFGWNGFAEWPMPALKALTPFVCLFLVVWCLYNSTEETLCFTIYLTKSLEISHIVYVWEIQQGTAGIFRGGDDNVVLPMPSGCHPWAFQIHRFHNS